MNPNPTASRVDDEVITAAVDGDREAFAEIYRVYYPVVTGYVSWRTGGWPHHAREDLVADVFVRALANIGRYEHQGRDIAAWLVTIARNLLSDVYKSSAYRCRSGLPVDECHEIADDTAGLDDVAHHVHLREALWRIVAALPAAQQEVIALRFYAGLSITETAACLGIDEGAVKGRQFRACRVLANREDVAALTRVE